MNSRDLMDVNSALNGPLWALFKEFAEERRKTHLQTVEGPVTGIGDLTERERSIGARSELIEIVEKFPLHVRALFEEAHKQEQK